MTTNNQLFFQKINEAFAKGDTDFIAANVTEDIRWNLVGSPPVHGKSEFIEAMDMMGNEDTQELTISNIITHGLTAAVDGTMKVVEKSGEMKIYAFCDIYRLNKFKNGKIREITSYVIETTTVEPGPKA